MEWYDKLWQNTVDLFRSLDIPVRTLECCSGDLADLKVKSVDVEAWSPRQKKYFEVGSCSNLGDAQARRLKIRVQASPTTLKMIELMGGSPTPISFGEVYTAMQQGVVDGAENNVPSWVQTRHIEIAKVFSEDEHASIPDFLVISSKTWDKLTPDQQQILIKAAKASEVFQQQLWRKIDADTRAQAKAMGGEIIKVDKAPFRAAVQPLFDDFKKDPVQAALLAKFEAAAE